MSLWNNLLSLLFGEGEQPTKQAKQERSRPDRPRSNRPYRSTARSGPNPGDLVNGRVEYVGDKFAKVASSNLMAVVFLDEMADRFIDSPSEVLQDGQEVDFVLIKNEPRGWVASISAVTEAKARTALSSLNEGDRLKGKIVDFKDQGVILDSGAFRVWLPIAELDWGWIDHPSEVVALGDEVEVEIIRVALPEGWLTDKRKRRARAIGSLRACLPQPESPQISIAFSSLPFKVWAIAKTPRSCDPVVLYILEDLVAGRSRENIQSTTGLPSSTLDQVHGVLVEEGLVKRWRPSKKGKCLVEAIVHARELNADPIRGLFASAAHPSSQFIQAGDQREQDEYPRAWPPPPRNRPAEDIFVRATDEALPETLIERIVTEDKRSILASLQEDDRLRVFLRRDGSRPWKPIYVDTPEHWLLAGLWSTFEPLGEKPFRPANGNSRCRDFLMIRCHAVARRNGKPLETLFFEPYTDTVWRSKDDERISVLELRGSSFPCLPSLGKNGIPVASGGVAKHLLPASWCIVGVS